MGLILDGTTGISASGNIYGANIIVTNNFTPTALSAVGNVQGDYIIGNGSLLTTITGANVTGAVPSATGAATATTASTVTTAAQPNITSVGILNSLAVTANISGGNVSVTGLVGGTLSTAAQPNVTSVGALTSLSVSGNITAPNVVLSGYVTASQGLQASSNYTGPYVDGIAVDYVSGNGRISVGTADGINFYTGGVANTEILSLTPSGVLSATGDVRGANLSASGNVIGGGLTISANTISTGNATMYLDPLADGSGNGHVVVLGNLDVRGTTTTINSNVVAVNDLVFTVANNASTSAAADGAGLAVGPDPTHYAELTFSNSGNTWVSSIAMSITGNVTVNRNSITTGNVTGGNLLTAGLISATGTITAANISGSNFLGTTLSAAANVTGGNILTGGLISAAGDITGGSSAYIYGYNIQTNNTLFTNYINPKSGSIVNFNAFGISTTGNVNATAFVGSLAGTATSAVSATTAATVTTAAQPNITSVGTLSSLTVTANISGGNILYGSGVMSGTGSVYATAFVGSLTGTATSAVSATTAATVTTAAQPNITSVGTLSSLTVTANISGGNLLTGGLISSTGAITGGALTGSSLTVSTGNISGGNINNNNANGVGNIGSSTTYFNTVFAKATSAQYADLAEMYAADSGYAPGTVVAFGGAQEVTLSTTPGDRRVAGVISTNPSYLMNSTLSTPYAVPVALTGRVPTMVTGDVRKGDLMVSNGDGTARAEANPEVGAVIGKALADFTGDKGTIEIVVGRL